MKSKCSQDLYCSYLEVTTLRFSALSLSEVVPEVISLSHDSISRRLASAKAQPKDLREVASKEISALPPGKRGILVFDDVVIQQFHLLFRHYF